MSIKSKNLMDKIRRNNPYFEDFITRNIYNSNAIEGNTISYAETYAIVFNDNSIKINTTPREMYEAINLKYAFSYVLKHLEDELSIKYIEQIGKLINKNISEINGLRKVPVAIRGAQHLPPLPQDVPRLMSELVYKMHKRQGEDIFSFVARFHLAFERVHPFEDGNGRTGRLLITKELLKRGIAPPVITVNERAEYFKILSEQNDRALASMLNRLSVVERERMKHFGIKL